MVAGRQECKVVLGTCFARGVLQLLPLGVGVRSLRPIRRCNTAKPAIVSEQTTSIHSSSCLCPLSFGLPRIERPVHALRSFEKMKNWMLDPVTVMHLHIRPLPVPCAGARSGPLTTNDEDQQEVL